MGIMKGFIATRSQMFFRKGNVIFNSAVCRLSNLPNPLHPTPRPQIDYKDLPAIAMKLYSAGIDQVSSETMIDKTLSFNRDQRILKLYISDLTLKMFQPHNNTDVLKTKLSEYHIDRNVHVLAVGKAVTGMCCRVQELLGEHLVQGVAVVPHRSMQFILDSGKEHMVPKCKFEILTGGDGRTANEESLKSAEYVSDMARNLKANDILITLISGGGSALLALPKPPLTLEDKMSVVQLMKAEGVGKLEENLVRKNLSLIKGGGLSEMASPATVISLTLSDLPHSLSGEVSGGLTYPDSSTPQQALEILRKYHLVDKTPKTVIDLLERDAEEAKSRKWYADSLSVKNISSEPKRRRDTSNTINILAGSDEIAVRGILSQCAQLAIPAKIMVKSSSDPSTKANGILFACVSQYIASILTQPNRRGTEKDLVDVEIECIRMGLTKGELKEIAKIVEDAKSMKKPVCIVFNSETITNIQGTGIGGPCQETALATAIELKRRCDQHECLQACDVQLLSIDSDGMDGGTSAAGAIANFKQADQIVDGKCAEEYLNDNDSYTFYSKLEGGTYHVTTGLTGTDIQNLQILLITNRAWTKES